MGFSAKWKIQTLKAECLDWLNLWQGLSYVNRIFSQGMACLFWIGCWLLHTLVYAWLGLAWSSALLLCALHHSLHVALPCHVTNVTFFYLYTSLCLRMLSHVCSFQSCITLQSALQSGSTCTLGLQDMDEISVFTAVGNGIKTSFATKTSLPPFYRPLFYHHQY